MAYSAISGQVGDPEINLPLAIWLEGKSKAILYLKGQLGVAPWYL